MITRLNTDLSESDLVESSSLAHSAKVSELGFCRGNLGGNPEGTADTHHLADTAAPL